MAAINAEVAEVAAQLSAIRLRRNALAAQRALAGAFSAAFVAGALIVASALRGSATVFTVAAAAGTVATLTALTYAIRYARREWLSLPATARLADTHARLDERLTTLMAVASRSPTPPLSPLLASQVIRARHSWDVATLAPQRLSRWLALVPLAILTFAAAAFYARPPGGAAARQQLTSRPLAPKTLAGAAVTDGSAAAAPALADGDQRLAMAGAANGNSTRDAAQSRRSAGADSGATRAGEGMSTSGAAADDIAERASGTDRMAELRQSIRQAFGAPPDDLAPATDGDRSTPNEARNGAANGRGADAARDGEQKAGDGASQNRPGDAKADGAPPTSPNAGANPTTAGARGSGRGGAGTSGSQGVLGTAGSPRLDADPAAPVAIKLAAISGVSPSQSEPQRRTGSVAAASTSATRSDTKLPDLAEQQLDDVTMQQLAVGPEHEAVVRRLFTRE